VKAANEGRVEVQREEKREEGKKETRLGFSLFLGLVWLSVCSHFSLPLGVVGYYNDATTHGRRC